MRDDNIWGAFVPFNISKDYCAWYKSSLSFSHQSLCQVFYLRQHCQKTTPFHFYNTLGDVLAHRAMILVSALAPVYSIRLLHRYSWPASSQVTPPFYNDPVRRCNKTPYNVVQVLLTFECNLVVLATTPTLLLTATIAAADVIIEILLIF